MPPNTLLAGRGTLPAAAAALTAMVSVQSGAAVAVMIFDEVTPAGGAWLRLGFGAVLLLLWARPAVRRLSRGDAGAVVALGGSTAVMTLCSFEAISRLPLGTVSALEFTGPLVIAVVGSRKAADAIWPVIALAGVLLLTRPWDASADWTGIGFALGAAGGLAGYILLTQRVADRFRGVQGIALSTAVAAVLMTIPSAGQITSAWWSPRVLIISALAAILLPILPHVLETFALRNLTASAYGTLMSLEPAVGTAVGFVMLSQSPSLWQAAGVAFVCVAGIAACRRGGRDGQTEPAAEQDQSPVASARSDW